MNVSRVTVGNVERAEQLEVHAPKSRERERTIDDDPAAKARRDTLPHRFDDRVITGAR